MKRNRKSYIGLFVFLLFTAFAFLLLFSLPYSHGKDIEEIKQNTKRVFSLKMVGTILHTWENPKKVDVLNRKTFDFNDLGKAFRVLRGLSSGLFFSLDDYEIIESNAVLDRMILNDFNRRTFPIVSDAETMKGIRSGDFVAIDVFGFKHKNGRNSYLLWGIKLLERPQMVTVKLAKKFAVNPSSYLKDPNSRNPESMEWFLKRFEVLNQIADSWNFSYLDIKGVPRSFKIGKIDQSEFYSYFNEDNEDVIELILEVKVPRSLVSYFPAMIYAKANVASIFALKWGKGRQPSEFGLRFDELRYTN
jgi:hypothetical protein